MKTLLITRAIYVIGDEQNYHMKGSQAFFTSRNALCRWYFSFELWYGRIPSGRMKSREGTVVDADDLVNEW
jgi:arginyl-tRNA synthetase